MTEMTIQQEESGLYRVDYIDGGWCTAYDVKPEDALKINTMTKSEFYDYIDMRYKWVE